MWSTMVVVKKVRKLGSRGLASGASHGTSSARPEFVAKEAPCAHACPAGTDVRGFLTTLARGGARGLTEAEAIEEAFYLIADRNPLPAVCGRLCPHHCETGCTREAYDGGVSVNQVERAIAEAAIGACWTLRRTGDEPRSGAVTVIGAGAAGLSAAYQLARRGYAVTLADPHGLPGGELRYGIDAERLPRAVLEAEVDRILALGVTFVGSADLVAIETDAPRLVKTTIYEDGTPVATGAIAAAVHFGRHAAALLDAEMQRTVQDAAQKRPPVAKDKVLVDHYPRQPRGATTGLTWSPSDAIAEAQRCLSCGACFACDNCWKYCPDQAVVKPQEKGQPYRFKLEYCQGCSKCAEQCPSNYIDMR
jgi:Pyruvate/2-oxoacid:ferredoxin oxidoreductase delta subunit